MTGTDSTYSNPQRQRAGSCAMPRKLDVDLTVAEKLSVSSAQAGQSVLLSENNDSWTCITDNGTVLGTVPTSAVDKHCLTAQHTTVIRSIRHAADNSNIISGIQLRIGYQNCGPAQPLVQAEPPADDPAGFTLTPTELERLAYEEEFRTALKDKRLQDLLLKIDGAANREQALKQALDAPDFRKVADQMLNIMKPSEY